MTVRIAIATDARDRLERMLGRKLETSRLEMGATQPAFPRPFLRRVVDEATPGIEKNLKVAIEAAVAEKME